MISGCLIALILFPLLVILNVAKRYKKLWRCDLFVPLFIILKQYKKVKKIIKLIKETSYAIINLEKYAKRSFGYGS